MKKLKIDWNDAAEQRLNGLNELDEFCLKAYESSAIYKENTKKYHDQKIEKHNFLVRDLVFLFYSMLRLVPCKLKSKGPSPYLIAQLFPYCAVEFEK